MTLPRKGDRVRVTDSIPGAYCKAGDEVTLLSDAQNCRAEFARGFITFLYEHPTRGERWSGGVHVEIIERADIDWAGATPAESFDYRCGYEAGLRRAQELAKEHLSGTFREFDQAIDAEAAKERA